MENREETKFGSDVHIPPGMPIGGVIRAVSGALQRSGVLGSEFGHHASLLVSSAIECSFADLILKEKDLLTPEQLKTVERFIQGRLAGIPLQYLRGWEWFWRSRFVVGPGVLIPRPETELLVDTVLKQFRNTDQLRVAELGAGSGNIGLSLLTEKPGWTWFAFENNPESLPYLIANRRNLGASAESYQVEATDFFTSASAHAPYDAIVSNPPYVAQAKISELAPEVRLEPHAALDGGERGDECVERLIRISGSLLKPGGYLFLEIGEDQGAVATQFLTEVGFTEIQILKDPAGHDRVATGCSEGARS